MKVVDLLEQRRDQWRRLEQQCQKFESRRNWKPQDVAQFGTLYRAACADLALADAYQLPPNTVQYLHQLVARAHNLVYRSREFQFAQWGQELFFNVPQRLFHDNALRLAFVLFWGIFLACMLGAYTSADFAENVLGKEMIQGMEEMYDQSLTGRNLNDSGLMGGFYSWHNSTIGLRCFAMGLLFGVGGLMELISNAVILGSVFGHMATVEQRENFFPFVTAHGPFELTAIVLSAAAGMRLGFALVFTGGWTREASLRRAAPLAVPNICLAVLLFLLAAVIEAFISPSALPYTAKAAVAVVSSGMLMFYFVVLGYPRGGSRATG